MQWIRINFKGFKNLTSVSFLIGFFLLTLCLIGFLPLTGEAQPVDEPIQTARVEKNNRSAQKQAEAILGHILEANQLPATTVSRFELLDSTDLNAATDGKKIMFTQGLWDALNTEDQRAFVLSHELAHISLHHVPKTMVRRVSFLGLNRFLSGRFFKKESRKNKLWKQASEAGLVLADLKFSRRAEYGADDLGLKMMAKASYNPQGAVETLDVLAKASPSKTPQFLMSHPLSKNRIRRLAERYKPLSFR